MCSFRDALLNNGAGRGGIKKRRDWKAERVRGGKEVKHAVGNRTHTDTHTHTHSPDPPPSKIDGAVLLHCLQHIVFWLSCELWAGG